MTTRTPASIAERERFVGDLLAYMSLEEKAGQLVVLPTAPDPVQRRAERDNPGFFDRLRAGLVSAVGGITNQPQADALQRIAIEESRLGIPLLFVADSDGGFDTIMPAPAAAAASWDPDAIEAAESSIAAEARARGINWVLAPEIRLIADCSHPEFALSSGADPYLAARIAVARIRGLQHEGPEGEAGTLACLGLVEDGFQTGAGQPPAAANGSLQIALEAVREGEVGSINIENPAHRIASSRAAAQHPALDLLHRPGNFEGMLLSDWAELAVMAGQDPLPRGIHELSVERLVAAVRDGHVAEGRVDDAVRRVLAAKFDLGLFRRHSRPAEITSRPAPPPRPRAREAALELARRSIILLRNADELLPLSVDSGDILVVGSAASDRDIALGGRDGTAASVIDGFEQLGIPFKYVPGLALRHEGVSGHRLIEADRMAIGMASEAARRSRTVVVVLGHGVVGARHSALGEAQRQLLSALRAANERIVLVTLGARPLNPAINGEPLSCVLHAGQLGTMSGHAIAELLTGDFSPSGRLPAPLEARDAARSLPFGYGLGYGRFGVTNFSLEMGADRILASVDLRNLGEFPGSETIQLYVRQTDDLRRAAEPALRAFRRITLQPGERRRVTFEVDANTLGSVDADGRFSLDEGLYEIQIGRDRARLHGAEIVLPAAVAQAMAARAASLDGIIPLRGGGGLRSA